MFDFSSSLSEFYHLNLFAVVFLGLVLGSFASALVYRVPRGISWIVKSTSAEGAPSLSDNRDSAQLRSACPECNAPLGIFDLFPVFSWVFLRGRCRHCKADISAVYPICELLTLLASLGGFAVMGFTPISLLLIFMMPFLVALVLIDFEHFILPNQLVLIFGVGGLVYVSMLCAANPDHWLSILTSHTIGFLLFGCFAWGLHFLGPKFLKKDALGFGDVKLFFAVGLWCGYDVFGVYIMLSGVLGALFASIWLKIKGDEVFPFGPALIASFYVVFLLDYLGLITGF